MTQAKDTPMNSPILVLVEEWVGDPSRLRLYGSEKLFCTNCDCYGLKELAKWIEFVWYRKDLEIRSSLTPDEYTGCGRGPGQSYGLVSMEKT